MRSIRVPSTIPDRVAHATAGDPAAPGRLIGLAISAWYRRLPPPLRRLLSLHPLLALVVGPLAGAGRGLGDELPVSRDHRGGSRLTSGHVHRGYRPERINSLEEFLQLLEIEDQIAGVRGPARRAGVPGVRSASLAARGAAPRAGEVPSADRSQGRAESSSDPAVDAGSGDSPRESERPVGRPAGGGRDKTARYSSQGLLGDLSVLKPPPEYLEEVEPVREDLRSSILDLDPVELKIEYERRPSYMPRSDYQPVLGGAKETEPAGSEAIKRLVTKQFYRHTRRLLKKYWRRQYKDSVSMGHDLYLSRISQINQIGRNPDEFDEFNTDYYANQARNDILDLASLEGEREEFLFKYGPVRIDDEGSFHFDVKELLGLADDEPLQLQIDPDHAESGRAHQGRVALFSGRTMSFKPKFRLKVDPFRAVGGDVEDMLRSYGGSVGVDFYSDIVRKKLFSTELEAKFRRDGDFAVFFNVVIHGRN